MGIFDFFKPRWARGTSDERSAAINAISDTQLLQIIIENEDNSEVQDAAVMRLLECAVDASMVNAALETLSSVERRKHVVGRIESQKVLEMIGLHYPDEAVRTTALFRIKDKVVRYKAIKTLKSDFYLKKVIQLEPSSYLRAAALASITSQTVLSELILQILQGDLECLIPQSVLQRFFEILDDQYICGLFVSYYHNRPRYARAAVDKINDKDILLSIIRNRLVHTDTRKWAIHKIPGDIPLWDVTDDLFKNSSFTFATAASQACTSASRSAHSHLN